MPIPIPREWLEHRSSFDRLLDAMMLSTLPAIAFVIIVALVNATIRWMLGYGFTGEMPNVIAIPFFAITTLLIVGVTYTQYRISGEVDDDDLNPYSVPLVTKPRQIRRISIPNKGIH